MSKIIGRLVELGIGKESTRGGGVAPTLWVPKADLTVDDKVAKARSTVNYGNIGIQGNQALVARKSAEGTIEMDMMSENFGLFLLALLGNIDTSGPSDSAYTHDFSLAAESNQHQSLNLHVKQRTQNELNFRLAMIESMQITITPEDVVKVSVNFMSRPSAVAGAQSPSYATESKFVGRHLTFKIEDATGDLAGGSNIPVRNLTINIEKNLRIIQNTGTVEPDDILNQGFNITGEVELDLEDRTYRDLALNGTYKAVRIQLTNTEDTISSGSTNPSFTLDLSRVDFEGWEPVRPNDEIASQNFTFTALHDLTNGNIINSCQLVNGQDGTNY